MLINDMTSKECSEMLARTSFGRLGCARDNQPYVVPIYFAYEPDHLYGFSTVGQKISWMRANPKVCVEVDEVTNHFEWMSVIVNGRYQELPDTPEFQSERRNAQLVLEKRMLWWQTAYVAEQLRAKSQATEPLFYCIQIDSMTGHRAAPDATDSTFLEISGF
jgi:nitroimidazol reductase NimA-like FMN-containing flavoprotein (pyridoxamine 5'-phosphate oxidase superfamily)